jgi:hypothetical protein
MMPAVTEWPRPKGLPMAITQSPTRALSESPNLTPAAASCWAVDLQHGNVDPAVRADQLGLELGVVAQDDGNVLRPLDDVVVGDDVAIGIDDEARAERGARRFCSSPPLRSKNSLNSSSNGEPGGSCGRSRRRGPCCGTFWSW